MISSLLTLFVRVVCLPLDARFAPMAFFPLVVFYIYIFSSEFMLKNGSDFL